MTTEADTEGTQRQNILNNPYALQEIEKATQIQGIAFERRSVVFKEQAAAFFDVAHLLALAAAGATSAG